jgi:hypothetical protein
MQKGGGEGYGDVVRGGGRWQNSRSGQLFAILGQDVGENCDKRQARKPAKNAFWLLTLTDKWSLAVSRALPQCLKDVINTTNGRLDVRLLTLKMPTLKQWWRNRVTDGGVHNFWG